MIAWYRRELGAMTPLQRDRIRGMWLTLPFAYPFVWYLAVMLVEWMY